MKRIITDAKLWGDGKITFFTNWEKQNNKICFTLDLDEILFFIAKSIKKRKRKKK